MAAAREGEVEQFYRAPSSPTQKNGSYKVLSPVKYDAKFISVDLVFPSPTRSFFLFYATSMPRFSQTHNTQMK